MEEKTQHTLHKVEISQKNPCPFRVFSALTHAEQQRDVLNVEGEVGNLARNYGGEWGNSRKDHMTDQESEKEEKTEKNEEKQIY